jgi:hypothetical protein
MSDVGGQKARAGLCASCAHAKIVTSSRESVFFLCQRSLTDPGFPRYPPLPVLTCRGYERLLPHEAGFSCTQSGR